jgi:hypothetical protein
MAEEEKHEEGDVVKKSWKVGPLTLRPIFEVLPSPNETKKQDVRCVKVGILVDVEDGKEQPPEIVLDFDQLYQFVYFCGAEEVRRDLMQIVMRPVTYIPYDVEFNLDTSEIQSRKATRRIELPVDAIVMALARMYGWEAFTVSKFGQGNFKDWYQKMTAQMKAAGQSNTTIITKKGGG